MKLSKVFPTLTPTGGSPTDGFIVSTKYKGEVISKKITSDLIRNAYKKSIDRVIHGKGV